MESSSNTVATPNFDNLFLKSLMSHLQIHHPAPAPLSDDNNKSSALAKAESNIKKGIVRIILGGETEKLMPNSGQSVTIGGGHDVCVGFHDVTESDDRLWAWHGHIAMCDDDDVLNGYIFGNYLEKNEDQILQRNFKANSGNSEGLL